MRLVRQAAGDIVDRLGRFAASYVADKIATAEGRRDGASLGAWRDIGDAVAALLARQASPRPSDARQKAAASCAPEHSYGTFDHDPRDGG